MPGTAHARSVRVVQALVALAVVAGLATAPTAKAEERIDARDGLFDPAEVVAGSLETVRWRWSPNETHGVAPDDEAAAAWCEPSTTGCTWAFLEPGEYRYHCPVHPEMRGVVHVQRRSGDPGAPLRALFSADVNGLVVELDAAASGESRTAIGSYLWSFGDGATGEGRRVRHEYAAPGNYTVLLTVVDEFGDKARTSEVVRTIGAGDPEAFFLANESGLVVEFDARPRAGRHTWDFGDGAVVVCENGCVGDPAATFSSSDTDLFHVYTRKGSFVVAHRIELANGTSLGASMPVHPSSDANFFVETDGLTMRVDARALPRYGNATFEWLFGDLERAEGEIVEHTFPLPGAWTVTLRAHDDVGEFGHGRVIELRASSPAASAPVEGGTPRAATPALSLALLIGLVAALARVSESYK